MLLAYIFQYYSKFFLDNIKNICSKYGMSRYNKEVVTLELSKDIKPKNALKVLMVSLLYLKTLALKGTGNQVDISLTY